MFWKRASSMDTVAGPPMGLNISVFTSSFRPWLPFVRRRMLALMPPEQTDRQQTGVEEQGVCVCVCVCRGGEREEGKRVKT